MRFLFDTVAVSEFTRPTPNAGFVDWVRAHPAEETAISTVSLGEIVTGFSSLPTSKKRRSLEAWLESLVAEFRDRILTFDVPACRAWGHAMAQAQRCGKTLPMLDAQIGAIAKANDLAVVTRNVKHFVAFEGIEVVNPWT